MELLPAFVGMPRNQILCGSAESLFPFIPSNSIDMGLTSPPYDNLRTYNGFTWDFPTIAREYYRVLKPGGVLVWVVGDASVDGNETLASFEHALYFKKVAGFKIHDTMIYRRQGRFPESNRYWQDFEYMFVMAKEHVSIFNPLKEISNNGAKNIHATERQIDGSLKRPKTIRKTTGMKDLSNVWHIHANLATKDKVAYEHPAIFPEELARRHIETWTNPSDIVLDCFMGSGTTAKMARQYGRDYIGFELSPAYVEIARKRLALPYTPLLFQELAG